jgi:branched-chain amino acid transport system substrate-binding protein
MKIIKSFLIIFILAIFGFGCSNSRNKDEQIKIGVILPLTGPASEIGNNILEGIKIANEEVNNNNSVKINLIIEDSKLDPKQAISSANKLVFVDKVKIIIGLASSTEALSVAPICEKNKVIMLSSTASTPLLTHAGDYIFRIYPSDVYDGKVLADFAMNKNKLKSFSIIYLNNDFGSGLKDVFIDNYNKIGGTIKGIETFLPNDKDFKTQLTKIKESNPDGLLVIAIDMQYINIVKQIRELNISSKIYAPVTFDNPLLIDDLGKAADDIIYSRPKYSQDTTNKQSKYFRNDYNKISGKTPSLLTWI